jgi:hypothetical protein
MAGGVTIGVGGIRLAYDLVDRPGVGSQHNFLTENSFALRCLLTETSRTSPIVHSRCVLLSQR